MTSISWFFKKTCVSYWLSGRVMLSVAGMRVLFLLIAFRPALRKMKGSLTCCWRAASCRTFAGTQRDSWAGLGEDNDWSLLLYRIAQYTEWFKSILTSIPSTNHWFRLIFRPGSLFFFYWPRPWRATSLMVLHLFGRFVYLLKAAVAHKRTRVEYTSDRNPFSSKSAHPETVLGSTPTTGVGPLCNSASKGALSGVRTKQVPGHERERPRFSTSI